MSDDDEKTLEEEEQLAAAESDADDEINALDEEANIPIEELLARWVKQGLLLVPLCRMRTCSALCLKHFPLLLLSA